MNCIKYVYASLILIISSSVFAMPPTYTLPSNEWRMISLPLTPPEGAKTVIDLFGDDLGDKDTYGTHWVLFEHDPAEKNPYRKLEVDETIDWKPGKGYWIQQIFGKEKTLTMPSNSYHTKPNPFPITLNPATVLNPEKEKGYNYQWSLVGSPYNETIKFDDLTLSPSGDEKMPCNHKKIGICEKLWRYKKGGYETIEAGGQLNPWDAFWTATNSPEESKITFKTFGTKGSYGTVKKEYSNSVVYHPEFKTKTDTPVIFFAPGWGTTTNCGVRYATMLEFIVSHGYTVICHTASNKSEGAAPIITNFKATVTALKEDLKNDPGINIGLDLQKIGIVGHSSGGGNSFKILQKFSEKGWSGSENGWGENGRFLFVMEPWFAFGMTKDDMKGLEKTNVVFVQFGKDGNNYKLGSTLKKACNTNPIKCYQDPRILLTQYSLLEGIKKEGNNTKDYLIFADAHHRYPRNDREKEGTYEKLLPNEMQGILRPLHALMQYTFREDGVRSYYDQPYEKGYQKLYAREAYDGSHKCDSKTVTKKQVGFDHCGNYKDKVNLP